MKIKDKEVYETIDAKVAAQEKLMIQLIKLLSRKFMNIPKIYCRIRFGGLKYTRKTIFN